MRLGITIGLSSADRCRLEALDGDRNTARKHVWRSEIVLLSAAGLGTNEILRRTGKSMTCVWRWPERIAAVWINWGQTTIYTAIRWRLLTLITFVV